MIAYEKRELVLKELEQLINRYSLEKGSDTPDWVLARHMLASLETFNATVRAREEWYGRGPKTFEVSPTPCPSKDLK